MCGIFGTIYPGRVVAPIIREGLKRLEYRGYDSVGISTIGNGELVTKKDKGKLDAVHEVLNLDDLPGEIGVGHTRWATHGAPSRENAHPLTDCRDTVAVVHNGIIENFSSLREQLEKKGHTFKSRTDSETVAHLIEDELAAGKQLKEAARSAVKQITGSYALVVLSTLQPDQLICVRNESPLVVGLGDGAAFCASDIPAFLPYTNKAIPLEDGDLAVLTSRGVEIENLYESVRVEREMMEITWTPERAQKTGYPHFMLKEIHEQPLALGDTLRGRETYINLAALTIEKARQIFLVAMGTSYHACVAGSYALSELAHIAATPAIAAEFEEAYGNTVGEETVVVAVSQSGETTDTLAAVRFAKERGAKVVAVTNTLGSSITRLSNLYVLTQAGPEIGVAATKTLMTQIATLILIALRLSTRAGDDSTGQIVAAKLRNMPVTLRELLESAEGKVRGIATRYAYHQDFYFLGRGISVATAMEGALKLKEISYIHAEAYPAGESKHGPIALVHDGFPCVFLCPPDATRARIVGNIMEMKARGASVISLIEEGDEEIKQISDEFIELPRGVPRALTPVAYVVPLQLFAYYAAVAKGFDPDRPRNLAKSVTVL